MMSINLDDLRDMVGDDVEIAKAGVTRRGMLMGKVSDHAIEESPDDDLWVIFNVDDQANTSEFRFDPAGAWTIKRLTHRPGEQAA